VYHSIRKRRWWKGIISIKKSAEEAAEATMCANCNWEQRHVVAEDHTNNFIAGHCDHSVFTRLASALKLHFLSITESHMNFIFLSKLCVGGKLGGGSDDSYLKSKACEG